MLHNEDRELKAVLSSFAPTPPSYLAQRIIANATALPQQRGFFASLTQAMSEWNYALSYKGMALACFMMLGIALAQNHNNSLNYANTVDMGSLVMAEGWMEE